MVQFNEVKFVQDFLQTRKKPERMGIKRLIRYLCSYYFDEYEKCSLNEFVDRIKDEMKLFNLSIIEYREFKYAKYIKKLCKKMLDGKLSHRLICCEYIDITEPEIEIIKRGQTEKHQKVLFTLFALAKVIPNPTGWVNYCLTDIFKLANVSMKNRDKRYLINDLYVAGLLELSNSLKLQGYKVQLRDGETAVHITKMEHFGRQYLHHFKKGWIMCGCCGKMVRISAPNQKYCKNCAPKQKLISNNNARIKRKMMNSGKSLQPSNIKV